MTREEAINIMKVIVHMLEEKYDTDRVEDAVDMAIEALSVEPCEDCISRPELLKAIDTWDKFGVDANTKIVPVKDCYVPYVHYDDIVTAIKGMPSVQPIRPKGEWIGNENGKCSVCGHEGCGSDIWDGCKDGMFCPNCGADLRGEV